MKPEVKIDIIKNYLKVLLPEYEKYLLNDNTIEPNSKRIRKQTIEELKQHLKAETEKL